MRSMMMKAAATACAFATWTPANLVTAHEKPTQSIDKPVGYGFAIDGGVYVVNEPRYIVEHLFIGTKLNRVVLTTGLELHNKQFRQGNHLPNDFSPTSPYWGIQIQVAILRSNDERVEWNGVGGFGIGNERIDPAPPNEGTAFARQDLNRVVRVGFGVQYWAVPHIAIGMNMGLAYRDVTLVAVNSEGTHFSYDYFGTYAQLRIVFVAGSP